MTGVAYTLTQPAALSIASANGVPGRHRFVVRDLTADTGTYASGGTTFTASQFGLKKISWVMITGGVATTGTSGATASPLGITYAAGGTSFTLQLYEGAASGAALGEKTNTEAFEASFTIRLVVCGY